jgi:hypothetical protein
MSLARFLCANVRYRSRPGLNRRSFRCKRNVITTRPRDHWWRRRASIPLPSACKADALPSELRPRSRESDSNTRPTEYFFYLYSPSLYHLSYHEFYRIWGYGPSGELNPGPLAPKARIIPLDH